MAKTFHHHGLYRDGASLGTPKELSLARSGRIYVQLSVSALHRALSHARMATLKVMDCFFIGTAWIDNGLYGNESDETLNKYLLWVILCSRDYCGGNE